MTVSPKVMLLLLLNQALKKTGVEKSNHKSFADVSFLLSRLSESLSILTWTRTKKETDDESKSLKLVKWKQKTYT